MADSTVWWLMAVALVALELSTGTFYLLMLAIGLAAGALAAHLGLALTGQLLVASVVGTAAVVGCYLVKRRGKGDPSPRAMRSVLLDVGESVQVDAWLPDGTAAVRYRGAQWTAVLAPGQQPAPGTFRVVELVGSRLVVERS